MGLFVRNSFLTNNNVFVPANPFCNLVQFSVENAPFFQQDFVCIYL